MSNSTSVVISELLIPGAMELELKSTSKDAVLSELVDLLPELRDQPEARQTLLKALHEREQLHSTGIGDGIALPHARNALVGLVHNPVIVFGRRADGIPFGAIDAVPTKLFFLLVAPNVTYHLGILARLSRLLREPKLRQGLLTADKPEKIITIVKEAEARFQAK